LPLERKKGPERNAALSRGLLENKNVVSAVAQSGLATVNKTGLQPQGNRGKKQGGGEGVSDEKEFLVTKLNNAAMFSHKRGAGREKKKQRTGSWVERGFGRGH